MRRQSSRLQIGWLLALAVWFSSMCRAEQPVDPEEEILKQANLATDSDSLVRFLHKQAEPARDLLQLDMLIGKLGSGQFQKRTLAQQRLLALALPALPA